MQEGLSIEDMGIFQNQEEVAENIKTAAVAVGANMEGVDKIKSGRPLEFLVAKKNCRQCWGRGQVSFIPNDPKEVRSTSRPEDMTKRVERTTIALCKCVKVQME